MEEAPPTYHSLFGDSLSRSGLATWPRTCLPVPHQDAIFISQLGYEQQHRLSVSESSATCFQSLNPGNFLVRYAKTRPKTTGNHKKTKVV